MKKVLSILSGRLMSLVFPAAVVMSFLVPANAMAFKELSLGGGDSGGTEGDPLDTNDYGSSGGGSDVEDQTGAPSTRLPLGFKLDRMQILLVPQFVGGTLIFQILVIDSIGPDQSEIVMEGFHAP